MFRFATTPPKMAFGKSAAHGKSFTARAPARSATASARHANLRKGRRITLIIEVIDFASPSNSILLPVSVKVRHHQYGRAREKKKGDGRDSDAAKLPLALRNLSNRCPIWPPLNVVMLTLSGQMTGARPTWAVSSLPDGVTIRRVNFQPRKRKFGGDTMFFNGKAIGKSEKPLYNAARWLLANRSTLCGLTRRRESLRRAG